MNFAWNWQNLTAAATAILIHKILWESWKIFNALSQTTSNQTYVMVIIDSFNCDPPPTKKDLMWIIRRKKGTHNNLSACFVFKDTNSRKKIQDEMSPEFAHIRLPQGVSKNFEKVSFFKELSRSVQKYGFRPKSFEKMNSIWYPCTNLWRNGHILEDLGRSQFVRKILARTILCFKDL